MKEQAIIRKVGNEYCVFYGNKKDCFTSEKEARDRLAEIEMFKHMKAGTFECECTECGEQFTTRKRCDLARCPACGAYEAEELRGED